MDTGYSLGHRVNSVTLALFVDMSIPTIYTH